MSENTQTQAKAEQGRKVEDQVEAAEERSFAPEKPKAMQAGRGPSRFRQFPSSTRTSRALR